MTPKQMDRARVLLDFCEKSKYKLDNYILLQQPYVLQVGDASKPTDRGYSALQVTVSAEVFQHAYKVWKEELRLKYNAAVRELHQLGVIHEYRTR